jgi:hypothetical protein
MKYRLNCWEVMGCGRQPFGKNVDIEGVCPAATKVCLHGVNDGTNGGRACWAIAGTMCRGEKQGTFAEKYGSCMNCKFYQMVHKEQGDDYMSSKDILVALKDGCGE